MIPSSLMLSQPVKMRFYSLVHKLNFCINALFIYLLLLNERLIFLSLWADFVNILPKISPLMFGKLDKPSSSNSWSHKYYKPVAVTCLQKLMLKTSNDLSFDKASRLASVKECSRWLAWKLLSFFESFRNESKEV